MSESHGTYYVPDYSKLPFFAALGLFGLGYGTLHMLHANIIGPTIFFIGALIVAGVMFFWFRETIRETSAGLHDAQMDRSYRWGMVWFIFSEVMLFGIFFFALFYARWFSVPTLGGAYAGSEGVMTHIMLWPNFKASWPLFANPNSAAFPGPKGMLHTWGIPALNTLILITSAITLTWAHWALKRGNRGFLIVGLILTIILGLIFLGCQTYEYVLAHTFYGLTLGSGIFGSTFFMLTGLHAAHVTIGIIMLIVILLRIFKGHFTPDEHFAFEAVAWYWHFVDVIWLLLFILVYWY